MRNRRAGIVLAILALAGVTMSLGATAMEPRFTDRARQAEEFLGHSKSIALTPHAAEGDDGADERALDGEAPGGCCGGQPSNEKPARHPSGAGHCH